MQLPPGLLSDRDARKHAAGIPAAEARRLAQERGDVSAQPSNLLDALQHGSVGAFPNALLEDSR